MAFLDLEIHCPHCHQWHRLEKPYADRESAEKGHIYFTCGNNVCRV